MALNPVSVCRLPTVNISFDIPPPREQSRGEEIANSISHGAGLVAALVAAPILVLQAMQRSDSIFTFAAGIFAVTMVLLYLASTLYHALPAGNHKRLFRTIEHSAIYLLIAGTYTPFTLGILRESRGWEMFALIWLLALAGITLKAMNKMSHPIISTSLYLFMGWLILLAVKPLSVLMPASGLSWLIAGGIAYTAGVFFFALGSRLQYGHFIWHLFVITGTACHYFAILWYAA